MLLLSNGSEGAARRIARAAAPGVETVEEPWDGWGDEIYEKIIGKKWEFNGNLWVFNGYLMGMPFSGSK